jgi:hypothetical protein
MARLTPEDLETAIKSAPASVRVGLAAGTELRRQTAARSSSLSIFEQLFSTSAYDDRQLALPLTRPDDRR